jgi:hypothetical protein
MSVVLVSDGPPEPSTLLHQVQARTTHHPLYVHSLEAATLPTHANTSANALLNLARVLAVMAGRRERVRVALFPAGLDSLPAPGIYDVLRSQKVAASRSPIVITLPIAPATRPRTDPDGATTAIALLLPSGTDRLWCPERVIMAMGRHAEWEMCVWSIWLETFGKLRIVEREAIVRAYDGSELEKEKPRSATLVRGSNPSINCSTGGSD